MKSYALALAVDGTGDGLISCFKEGKKLKQEERYWKVKCDCSLIINFTKILLKISPEDMVDTAPLFNIIDEEEDDDIDIDV